MFQSIFSFIRHIQSIGFQKYCPDCEPKSKLKGKYDSVKYCTPHEDIFLEESAAFCGQTVKEMQANIAHRDRVLNEVN